MLAAGPPGIGGCVNALIAFWRGHGTKILGTVAAFVAGVQGAASIMTPNPLTPHQALLLAGLNAALALWTVKRGFENSAQNVAPPAP